MLEIAKSIQELKILIYGTTDDSDLENETELENVTTDAATVLDASAVLWYCLPLTRC
jgi:hypothetical protein